LEVADKKVGASGLDGTVAAIITADMGD